MKWIIGCFIILFLFVAGFFVYQTFFTVPPVEIPNPSNGNENTLFPVSPSNPVTPIPPGDNITLTTRKGSVTTKNFLKTAEDFGAGVYALSMTENYHINYYRPDNGFQIAILTRPAQTGRDQAETALLEMLGITEQEACKLLVSLSVPFDVDPSLATKEFGLSFCPDGIPF